MHIVARIAFWMAVSLASMALLLAGFFWLVPRFWYPDFELRESYDVSVNRSVPCVCALLALFWALFAYALHTF